MLFWEVLYCTPILVLACVAKQKILGYQTHIIVLTVLYKWTGSHKIHLSLSKKIELFGSFPYASIQMWRLSFHSFDFEVGELEKSTLIPA